MLVFNQGTRWKKTGGWTELKWQKMSGSGGWRFRTADDGINKGQVGRHKFDQGTNLTGNFRHSKNETSGPQMRVLLRLPVYRFTLGGSSTQSNFHVQKWHYWRFRSLYVFSCDSDLINVIFHHNNDIIFKSDNDTHFLLWVTGSVGGQSLELA